MHALLFAAGEGRRMRPLTQILPKPLIEVGGGPMAVRQILALRKAGITEIVVNAAHGARILMAELGDGRSWGVKLLWSIEGFTAEDALETRGGIVRALPLLGSDPFIAVAGDIVTDFDYSTLVRRARTLSAGGSLAHLVLVPNPGFHARGDFGLADGKVCRTGEKFTFSSLALYHPAMFEGLPDERAKLFPWMNEWIDRGQVSGELYRGRWANVGTPEELSRAEALFAGDPA